MPKLLISGLVNVETTVKIRQFPVEYYPIDYPFFGVESAVSGVAYNIATALNTLNDEVRLLSMTGKDFQASYIRQSLIDQGISPEHLQPVLRQTPSSAVLYEDSGRRQIYCDLKDIQETAYPMDPKVLEGVDLVVACNINFNRPLLSLAKAAGKKIATDVHVLGDLRDEYNQDFLRQADIVFLSDEAVGYDHRGFLAGLVHTFGNEITVLGRGSKGATLCLRDAGQMLELPAIQVGPVRNTVGAGDALFSGFVHYYSKGCDPLESLIRAELFASAKICTSGGAQGFVCEAELEGLYQQFSSGLYDQIQTFSF